MPAPFPLREDNPLTLVYNKLWELARANPDLMEWINANNQIDFSQWIGGKTSVSTADFPELALTSQSSFSNIRSTSTSTILVKEYSWMLITGDQRMDAVYNQVQWELFRAMIPSCEELVKLTWGNAADKNFVKRANWLTSSEGSLFLDENRNIRGWSFSWPLEVEMHFTTSKLTEGLSL